MILACTVFAWSTRVTDRRTDGRAELRWLRRAIAVPAVARKNTGRDWAPAEPAGPDGVSGPDEVRRLFSSERRSEDQHAPEIGDRPADLMS